MRWSWALALVLTLGVLSLAPSVQAGLISKHTFQVGIDVVSFEGGKEQNVTDLGLTLMTGQIDANGERKGLYGFVNVRSLTFSNIEKIEVVNTKDQAGALQRALQGQCSGAEACLIEKTWTNPVVSLFENSTMVLFANSTAVNHTEKAPFGLALLVEPPKDLAGGSLGNLSTEQSGLLMGDQLTGTGRLASAPGTNGLYAILPNNQSSLTIVSGDESRTYSGGDIVFHFYGPTQWEVAAAGLLVPFQGDSEIRLSPSPGNVLREQFNVQAVNDVFKSLGSNNSVVPPEVASNFNAIAPILNGVLFGGLAAPVVDQEAREDAKLALIRFSHITVKPAAEGGATASGRTDFLMFGTNGFYTDKTGTNLGFLRVPTLAWILWGLAIGAIIAGFALKPLVAPAQVGAFGAVRLVGLVFHILALTLAFVLWDFEIQAFLGTSLITLFADGALGSGPILVITAFFQLVPFFAAGFLFGLPVRFLVNNGLKLGGLKKAGGIGKGIGDLAIWGLGAPFIPFFLNGVIQPIVEQLGGLFG